MSSGFNLGKVELKLWEIPAPGEALQKVRFRLKEMSQQQLPGLGMRKQTHLFFFFFFNRRHAHRGA